MASLKSQEKSKGANAPKGTVCGNCLAPEGSANAPKLSACSRCGLVTYCSKDCQRAHWKANHKHCCVAKADRKHQTQKLVGAQQGSSSKSATVNFCVVCLEELTPASVTCALPCKHIFHNACLKGLQTFGAQQVCPLCRKALPEKIPDDAMIRYARVKRIVDRGDEKWTALPAILQDEMDAAINKWKADAGEGNATAQFNLGSCYSSGHGVPQNATESSRWFKKAAERGLDNAQFNLGLSYKEGKGVPQSHKEAFRWYKKAADQGHRYAQANLACMFADGVGVAQSDAEATRYFELSAHQGFDRAQYRFGLLIGKQQRLEESAQWFLKAANQGNMDAQYAIGLVYENGVGVAQSDKEAMKWISRAAAQGHSYAQSKLQASRIHMDIKRVSLSDLI